MSTRIQRKVADLSVPTVVQIMVRQREKLFSDTINDIERTRELIEEKDNPHSKTDFLTWQTFLISRCDRDIISETFIFRFNVISRTDARTLERSLYCSAIKENIAAIKTI